MMARFQELDHLKIPLHDIKMATNNFDDDNLIGQGGFGRIYKGQLYSTSVRETCTKVDVKRLDVKISKQGHREFLTEIVMLASYKHENLVSLVRFSDEGDEKIIVYEHEVNGSLDNYLASTNLTWEQRIRICLSAAHGLDYLHSGVGAGYRVVHRDIKSPNVLLDGNWKAKISDFGLCKIGPKDQKFTFLVTNVAGTFGYVDPQFVKTGVLTKESDVYSFGVVLFEVLCGRLAMIVEYDDVRRFLVTLVKIHYEKGKLDEIVIPGLLKQLNTNSLKTFSKIAFECLNEDRKQRPTMRIIVKELETALELQMVSYHFLQKKIVILTFKLVIIN